MSKAYWWIALLLAAPLAWGQGEADETEIEDGDDDETVIDISGGDGDSEEDLQPAEEPNKPASVRVGEWTPPALSEDARRELDAVLAERGAHLEDAGVRYRLADFYLKHGWFLQAESEYLSCAQFDPESIRPWEGLLRVYRGDAARIAAEEQADDNLAGRFPPGIPAAIRKQLANQMRQNQPRRANARDWLPSEAEREMRKTRAYEEILNRRPDDIARRRELLVHLQTMRDFRRIAIHARAVLERLPADVATRFELAEAVRRDGFLRGTADITNAEQLRADAALLAETNPVGAEELVREADQLEADAVRLIDESSREAMAHLEENVKRAPDHAPSALRLVRMIAAREGHAASDRIAELEQRGFFNLFCVEDLAPVPYREDTLRLARSLSGPRLANRLWDSVMVPPETEEWSPWQRERRYYLRWIKIHFTHSSVSERSDVIKTLRRRGDQAALGTLVAFLWHEAAADELFTDNELEGRSAHDQLMGEAIEAAAAFGGLCYPAAERFLIKADTRARRARGVALIRTLKDPRAVGTLIDALAWEVGEESPDLGIASALEELGDPRAIDALVAAALDVRRPVARRRVAAEALAAFDDPRSVETLNTLAKEGEFRLVTAYGLFRLNGDGDALARIRVALSHGGEEAYEVLRMIGKWTDPRFEGVLLEGLASAELSVRPKLYATLKERYWSTAQHRAEAILLKAAADPGVSDWILRELGVIGGEEAATRLAKLLEVTQGERWEMVATAYARSGDPRAVRYFNRMRILEKDEARRRLARTLHNLAAASQAERARKAGD